MGVSDRKNNENNREVSERKNITLGTSKKRLTGFK